MHAIRPSCTELEVQARSLDHLKLLVGKIMATVCKYCQAVFSLTPDELHALEERLKLHPREPSPHSTTIRGINQKCDRLDETGPTCDHTKSESVLQEPLSKRLKLGASDLQYSTTPTIADIEGQSFSAHCIACLGLNSEEYIEGLVNMILETLDDANYTGVSSFVLAIHAPLSLKVRRIGMEYLVRLIRQGDDDPAVTEQGDDDLAVTEGKSVDSGNKRSEVMGSVDSKGDNGHCSGESGDLCEINEQLASKPESVPMESKQQNEAYSSPPRTNPVTCTYPPPTEPTCTDPPLTSSTNPPPANSVTPTNPINAPPSNSTNPPPATSVTPTKPTNPPRTSSTNPPPANSTNPPPATSVTPTNPTNPPRTSSTNPTPTNSTNPRPTTSTKPHPPDCKPISDEYYVKSNVRSRAKYQIEKRRPELTYNVDSPFLITVKVDHVTSNQDCLPLIHMASISIPKPKVKRQYRKFRVQSLPTVTTSVVHDALEATTVEEFSENNFFLSPVEKCCSYEIEFLRKPLFVGGRYNKYSRTLPQTPWILDGVRKVESSVEELICDKITDLVRASGHNFSSSGREDVDVRMLGNGRPFLVEFINPRNVSFTNEELARVQVEVNDATSLIEVRQLKVVTKESTIALKEGEQEKQKCYSAVIWAPEEITPEEIKFLDDLKDVTIDQKTPLRVLHRRSLSTRQRKVYSLQTTFIDNHRFVLELTTQAGTYVKEFVHGDFGRTQPNLREILKQDVDILSLDVLEVKLEWPL